MKELQVQVPWWLRNAHVQTLLAHFLPLANIPYPSQPQRIPLPDGDGMMIHDVQPPDWQPGGRIAVLLHGLGGTHQSAEVLRLSRRLLLRGVRAVRVDLRGCGAGIAHARKSYHAGCSDDIRVVLDQVVRCHPQSPLWLLGISLGGNVVLKLAGELGAAAWPNLERVVALCPPIDLPRCADLLALRRNRVYEFHFVRLLVRLAEQRYQAFPDLPRIALPAFATMRQFDDLLTSPMHGFAGASDYYQRASALPYIDNIRIPTLVLTSRDDPFIAVEPFEKLPTGRFLQTHIVPHGGHLGFFGWSPEGDLRWAEHFVLDWLFQGKLVLPTSSNGAESGDGGSSLV